MPPSEESPEALIELLKDQHSPWALPPGCSPQDQHLREMAVLEPKLIRGSNVFRVLKSLRIVDKGVSASAGTRKAAHLQARKPRLPVGRENVLRKGHLPHPWDFPGATIAAGVELLPHPQRVALIHVTHVSCRSTLHVSVTLARRWLRDTLAKPNSLQVEEVDEGLLQLEQLEELILSANHISRITSANLPRTLKVLELCCNAVADLQDLCAQPPPELQHLGLGYNRLCGPSQDKFLTAAFWPNLVSLDLSFNNLTDLLGLVSQLSSLEKLRILVLKGNPLALIPTYRGFLVDSLPKLSVLDDIHIGFDERHQFLGLARQPELMRSEARVVVSVGDMKGVPDPSTLQQLADDSGFPVITYSYCVTYEFVEGEELDNGSSTEVTKIHQSPEVATLDADSSAQDTGETKSQQDPAATEEPKASSAKVFVTPGKPWEDTIDYSYRKEHIVKDLMRLKSYLAAGTIVSVVEEKVLSWPVEADPEENTDTNKKAGRGQQMDGAKGPARKDKQKKKKEKSCELRSDPPIRRTLGTRKVTLEALLATEDLVTTLCDFGILITEQPPQPPSVEEKEKSKRKAPVYWWRVKGCSRCH
ncbi:leucine-rich repeat-containing protein 43 isoform X1 [Strigops habroptila]|uniref:leucine-rich repeat-containing protein 43 isoform X1 n=1 Tax=Strigops habroptila TaxID=2489341 RepID=UPI0011CF2761|nr:leucine-rich repeat-containing protein 43 isoform X1 [Strigops habroptila]